MLSTDRRHFSSTLRLLAWIACVSLAIVAGLTGGAILAASLAGTPDALGTPSVAIGSGSAASDGLWNIRVAHQPAPSPPQGPRTAGTVELRTGPGKRYQVVGTLPDGATLAVVGRDQDAEWIAVEFPAGSSLVAWIAVGAVIGLADPEMLTVRPREGGR